MESRASFVSCPRRRQASTRSACARKGLAWRAQRQDYLAQAVMASATLSAAALWSPTRRMPRPPNARSCRAPPATPHPRWSSASPADRIEAASSPSRSTTLHRRPPGPFPALEQDEYFCHFLVESTHALSSWTWAANGTFVNGNALSGRPRRGRDPSQTVLTVRIIRPSSSRSRWSTTRAGPTRRRQRDPPRGTRRGDRRRLRVTQGTGPRRNGKDLPGMRARPNVVALKTILPAVRTVRDRSSSSGEAQILRS